MKLSLAHFAVFTAACGLLTVPASAAVFTDANLTYTNSFDNFRGAGFVPDPAAYAASTSSTTDTAADYIDSDDIIARGLFDAGETTLTFGGQAFSDFAKGASGGNSSSGGVYGFDVDNSAGIDRALGVALDGNNFTPGEFVFRFTNNASDAISSVSVSADLFSFNRVNGTSSMTLLYSVGTDPVAGNGTANNATLAGTNAVPNGSIVSGDAIPATLAWSPATNVSETLDVSVPVGESFFLYAYFREINGRDNFAIDNVSVTATVVPEPSALALLALAVVPALRRHRRA